LILTAEGARWTQIQDARRGATVLQSLPSGRVEDVKGAKSAKLERVWYFQEGGGDMVQIGNAYLTADHPILTDQGWLLASQAAAKGYGQPPSERELPPLCGLQLTTGGNILINTSTTQDLASVFIEVATLGYRFLSSPDPLNGTIPTYAVQQTDPRHGPVDQTKPSYSQVTSFHHQGMPKRPFPLSSPETHASPKPIAGSDRTTQGHPGKPITGVSAMDAQIAQLKPEECTDDLEAARSGSQEIRPLGAQRSGRTVIPGDGPGGVEERSEAVHGAQGMGDGSTGNTTRECPRPTLPRPPTSSSVGSFEGLNTQTLIKHIRHDDSLLHQEKHAYEQAIWADAGDGDKGARGGSDGIVAGMLPQRDTTDIANETCHAAPANGTPTDSARVTHPQSEGSGTPDTYSDILIQNPKGEGVPAHEVRWEPSPCRGDDGDYLQLLEVVPGHHLFRASSFAFYLCNMVGTDPRSQFYKNPAIGNLPQTPEPPYSRGNGRTTKRLEIYASRRQTRAEDKKGQTEMVSPENIVSVPSHKREHRQPATNPVVPSPQGPNPSETEAISHDDNLFYKNGKPKPITKAIARPRVRGLTSKARKRLGGRKRNRRRNQRGLPSDEVSKESNPTTIAPTEGACFGTKTALPDQDPLSWETSITPSRASQGGIGIIQKLTKTRMRRKRYAVQRQARDIVRKEQIIRSVKEVSRAKMLID